MSEITSAETQARAPGLAVRMLEVIASIAIAAVLIHVLANVIMRSFFNAPIAATNEIVGHWYLPIIAFVGFVVAKTRNDHIEATLVYDRLSPKNKLILSIGANFLSAIALSVFAYYTFLEAVHGAEVQMTAGVTGVTIWPVLWLVPFGFGMLAIMYAIDVIKEIRFREPAVGERPLH